MSEHHDENDSKLMRKMRKLDPWLGLNSIVSRESGAIPKKYRELIAIAVSATTQWRYCMETHVEAAPAAGAGTRAIAPAGTLDDVPPGKRSMRGHWSSRVSWVEINESELPCEN